MGEEGKFFKLRSQLNGLVLDIEGKNDAPGARVTLWEDNDGDNQLWYEDHAEGCIRSKLNDYALELGPDGAFMQPHHPDEDNQHLDIEGGHICLHDNPNTVMDIEGSDPNPGSHLIAFDNHGGHNQLFDVEYQPPRYMWIKSKMNGKVLDVDEGDTDPGTKAIMYTQKDMPEDNQLWWEDKYGYIRSKLHDFALEFDDDYIRLMPYDPDKITQQWCVSGDTIRNKVDNNLVLDIDGADSGNGARIIQYDYSGDDNQLWDFEYIEL